MRKTVWGIFFFLLMILWFSKNAHLTPNEQIQQIDTQIEELKEKKRGYEARAIWNENQGDRLQFEENYIIETRRYYRLAEENQLKAQKVQEEIERLKAKRELLLQR